MTENAKLHLFLAYCVKKKTSKTALTFSFCFLDSILYGNQNGFNQN